MTMKNMNYQLLGRSGLRVSDLCLGTMTFGEDWGWGAARDEARKIYDTYREAGGNFIDTANIYTNGSSEKLVGEFIAGHRGEVVLATKYTNAAAGFTGKPGTDANAGGNQRKNMVQAVEAGRLAGSKRGLIDRGEKKTLDEGARKWCSRLDENRSSEAAEPG
jgi:aryl-alcohol dehydrogenase-like predicted oxidoreductase